jgi:recombination protein RecA
MAPKKKAAAIEEPTNVNAKLKARLAELGVGDLVKFIDEYAEPDVECVSTSFPQLDLILHPIRRGMPRGRDVEIFSKEPEVGKTSLALEIVRAFQQAGRITCIADAANTITKEYLEQLAIQVDPEEDPTKYAVILHKHEGHTHSLEDFFKTIRVLSDEVDLIVVDDVASLETQGNLDKEADENNQTGGISKKLAEFTRKNTCKKATIIWINQSRMKIGGYNPTGQPQYITTGGKALPFFCSIRLELSIADKIKRGEEVLGYRIKVYIKKKMIAAPEKCCYLTYMFDEGFSQVSDYLEYAKEHSMIEKKGAWFNFEDVVNALWARRRDSLNAEGASEEDLAVAKAALPAPKVQGDPALYELFRDNTDLFEALKSLCDGEPAEEPVATAA